MRKFIPKFLLQAYHFALAVLAAIFYRFPSRQMIVIGVTGTNGKSTVCNLIAKVLEEAGFKVGLTSTLNFKIGDREWLNETKMTMLGRFGLQKLLKEMVGQGCQYAVVETSSEGIAQYRHVGINYDVAVFTNLTPEHIERHGSFETYREMKGKLFGSLGKGKRKKIGGNEIKKTSVINFDDEQADYFLKFAADDKRGYGINAKRKTQNAKLAESLEIIRAEDMKTGADSSQFIVHSSLFTLYLLGEFNVYNSLAAVCVGLSQGVGLETSKKALEKVMAIPGRMERIGEGQNFSVFVDYAHNPDALEKTYQAVGKLKDGNAKIIGVLGAAGGGRDKWKRPEMGKLAAQYCDIIIITNEDPYDENPEKILEEIFSGFLQIQSSKFQIPNSCFRILDRREAIEKAFSLAGPGDIVIVTGKGSEQCIMGPKGEKTPWDDRKVVRQLLGEMQRH